MIKYTLMPGHVVSKNDGQVHYIGARQLAELYGVPMEECVIYREGDYRAVRKMPDPDTIWLAPRYDGNYVVPTRK